VVTIEQVRQLALALPETAEVPAWEGELTWRVRNKIFVMGAPESTHVTVKTSKEEQQELCAADPETFRFAAYVGRFGWTSVQLSTVDIDELGDLIRDAWRRTAPKTLLRKLAEDHR
jgi:hypothetical protein